MSRFTDALSAPRTGAPPPLPVVDWRRIDQQAPEPVPISYSGANAPLPRADVVVLTWTSAEWSALDQVFFDSARARPVSSREFERTWTPYLYARDVGANTTDNAVNPLWGYFRLARVTTGDGSPVTALLFKCDAHLAHPPWISGLSQMVEQILEDAQPRWIYSIGTAGGSRPDVMLGDVVITGAAHIELRDTANVSSPLANQTISCSASVQADGLLGQAQAGLLYALDNAVSYPVLNRAFHELRIKVPAAANLGIEDLLGDALRPEKLTAPRALVINNSPLLTTDYYYIATGNDSLSYAALEMDDGVVGAVAAKHGTNFAFVRNISDPLVPEATSTGEQIGAEVRDGWSGLIYQDFGAYTSHNGAIVTWALIAGGNS